MGPCERQTGHSAEVARLAWDQEVVGSIPTAPTMKLFPYQQELLRKLTMKMISLGVITDAVEHECIGCGNPMYIPQYEAFDELRVCKSCKQRLKEAENKAWKRALKMIPVTRHEEFKYFMHNGVSSEEFEQWFNENKEAQKACDIIVTADFVTERAFKISHEPPW